MEIRVLRETEIHEALEMSAGIFSGLEQEEEITHQAEEGNLILAGCFGDGPVSGLLGWGMVDSGGQILFVYVREEHRRHGMGTAITGLLCQVCSQNYSVLRIMAEVPPELVPFFGHCGLRPYGPEQQRDGRSFLPMELMISPVQVKPHKNGFGMGLLIGGVCVAALLLCVLIFLLGRNLVQEISQRTDAQQERQIPEGEEDPYKESEPPEFPDPGGGDGTDGSEAEEGNGFDEIQVYVSEDTAYELTGEAYTEQKEDETSYIDYDVHYPQVSGLPSGRDEEVNQILRDAAMAYADQYYLEPDAATQEFLAQQEYLYLGSQVEYKVTYMDENLLCVIFDDHYFTGSIYGEYAALRVRVIDLNTAERYEIQDLLQTDEVFLATWREKIKEEDPDNYPAAELPDEVFQATLTGEVVDGRYFSNLLLTGQGVEVGFTYAFRSADGQRLSRGWVTAPFSMEEIAPYQTDSPMWEKAGVFS